MIQVHKVFPFALILTWDCPTPNYTVTYIHLILLSATHITSPVRQVQTLSDFMNQMKVFFLLFLPLFCFVNHFWNWKTPLMPRWNGCICGEDAAGCFLHCNRQEQITEKKIIIQPGFSTMTLFHVYMRVPFHSYIIMWFVTVYLHSVYKQKDLAFMRGRLSRWGHVEGGTVDYETSVACMARTVTSFVKWRLTSDPCTSDEAEETPLFRNGSGQEVLNEPNTPSSSEENWQIHNAVMKQVEKFFLIYSKYKRLFACCSLL